MADRLIPHRRYRVRYRLEGQRRDREMVATYLGWSKMFTQYDFDLRPDAGTMPLPPGVIIEAWEVGKNVKTVLPRVVPS
jgi:hypothetical protein